MNSELDVTLLREDELALKDFPFRPNCHCNTCFLLRRLIEERGRANRFDDALTRIIGLCAPNSKRGAHRWGKANPLPAPPEKGKK